MKIGNTILNYSRKKNKTRRCTFNKTCIGSVHCKLQNANERNQRRPKQMMRPTVFMNQKTQHDMSVLSKWTYRFFSIPIKISARLFVDTDKYILNLYGKAQAGEQLKQS